MQHLIVNVPMSGMESVIVCFLMFESMTNCFLKSHCRNKCDAIALDVVISVTV